MTPLPRTTSLPLSLSHCGTGLVDNPPTVSETTQGILKDWPKLGAETELVKMLIAVFGTVQIKQKN